MVFILYFLRITVTYAPIDVAGSKLLSILKENNRMTDEPEITSQFSLTYM